MLFRVIYWGCAVGSAIILLAHCAPTTEVTTEPAPETKPEPRPGPPGIALKGYHYDMREEMQKSYEKADEIIMGVYSGNHMDYQNLLAYYFDNFMSFNKESLGWGPVMNILLSVHSPEFKPEIVTLEEFQTLSDLDKVGICWDYGDQKRYMYLIEGQQMLIFLDRVTDEINNTSYRNLIDIYPETEECSAKALFDWMIQEYIIN